MITIPMCKQKVKKGDKVRILNYPAIKIHGLVRQTRDVAIARGHSLGAIGTVTSVTVSDTMPDYSYWATVEFNNNKGRLHREYFFCDLEVVGKEKANDNDTNM
jgi:hypothetical protein